jgi:hypothetical protein
LFAEPPERNPAKLGDPNVVNIMDYKVDNTGKTVETAKINQAIGEVSAKPGGGVHLPKFTRAGCRQIRQRARYSLRFWDDAGSTPDPVGRGGPNRPAPRHHFVSIATNPPPDRRSTESVSLEERVRCSTFKAAGSLVSRSSVAW